MLMQMVAAGGVLALLTLAPGPDMAVVTRRAIASGRADGLRTAGGIVVGLLVWGVLTVAGLAAILAASAQAYLVVKLLGAVYLVLLGVQALWHSRRGTPPPAAPGPGGTGGTAGTGSAFRTGLVCNLLNPKIAVFYTGLLPTLAPDGMPLASGIALLVLLHVVLVLIWLTSYVYAISRARSVFERPRVRRALGRITGVVLIGFGIQVATANH